MNRLSRYLLTVVVGLSVLGLEILGGPGGAHASSTPQAREPVQGASEHVILFVLEGLGQDSLKGGAMPVISNLVKDGAATWSATGVDPALRLPTMASIVTGMPVEKHGITWNVFEFSRGYPRSPSMFDYLDLSGGRDSAIFYMDESLYQLARPEVIRTIRYVARCGPSAIPRRLCLISGSTSESHERLRLWPCDSSVPASPGRASAGSRPGRGGAWVEIKEYCQALQAVDNAMRSVLDVFREHGLSTGPPCW